MPRELWLKAGEAGSAVLRRPRGVRRPGRRRLPLQRDPLRGADPRRRQRPRLLGAHRHHRPLPHQPRHRRAEAALAARLRLRRDHHRDRDDGAGRGQRPPGRPHHRGRQGRPLPAQRLEDLHQQRHQRRPGHRGRAHRPRGRAQGHQPAGRRARHGGLRARPQPRQDRAARPGHRRALVHRRRRTQGEPARRGGRGLHLPDDEPAPGAADHRRAGRRGVRGRSSRCASTTPRPARRSASRSASSSTTGS